jgi:predicted nuclease of predicted toxin-antitoxin system
MIRVLLDQGLSPATAGILRQYGWDAVHVADIGLERSTDLEILEFCRADQRSCVTLDHDFHAHLAILRSHGPSVVLLRVEGLKASAQATLIRAVWQVCQSDLDAGAAVSADSETVRVRRLPLR